MPRGDRTGPLGVGPMSGTADGFCAGYPVPGCVNPAGGRRGWFLGNRGWSGRGGGGGFRHRLARQELRSARERMAELEKEKGTSP